MSSNSEGAKGAKADGNEVATAAMRYEDTLVCLSLLRAEARRSVRDYLNFKKDGGSLRSLATLSLRMAKSYGRSIKLVNELKEQALDRLRSAASATATTTGAAA